MQAENLCPLSDRIPHSEESVQCIYRNPVSKHTLHIPCTRTTWLPAGQNIHAFDVPLILAYPVSPAVQSGLLNIELSLSFF